jgi:hypothetical protein
MSWPKEPNYFSDDENYARGPGWYAAHFRADLDHELTGESSTHYTKLPTYPRTVARLARDLPNVRLIYVMRHPIDRLVSQYQHERNVGAIAIGIDEAVEMHSELVDYSRYAMQLEPYREALGPERVLPVFFRRLIEHSQEELERVGRFVGYTGRPIWDATMKPLNAGTDRLRRSALRHSLASAPLITPLRQRLIPRGCYSPLKRALRDRTAPPRVGPDLASRLSVVFDEDLAQLGDWLGVQLSCETFDQAALEAAPDWVKVG